MQSVCARACILKGVVVPFNVGMGQVENGYLYLRYGSNSVITTAKCDKTLTDKTLHCIMKNAPRVLLAHAKAEKNKHENFDFVHLSFFFLSFFLLLTHNPRTVTCI